jgi:Dolichyl-phosphate-mannose-protein mannosyltransferase
VLLTVLIGASRVLARQRSFWEWDDYIFGLALHIFAPQSYVPQPPFFPAFIFAARFANRFLHDDVAALTWVSVVSSGIATGLVFAIARELIDDVRSAWSAALLFAFFPAVWFAAGTPISDTAGVSAALGAVWLSIRGHRDSRFLLPAAAAIGLAIGVRPQTALIAFLPFAIAVRRSPRRAAAALSLLAVSVGIFWAFPVLHAGGGVGPVLRSTLRQWNNVVGGTSPLAHRTSVAFVMRRWLIDTWSSPYYAAAAWAAVGVGVAAFWKRRDFDFLVLVGTGTCLYAACAVLFLDLAATGRYVIPMLPAAAIAAAIGLGAIEGHARLPRGSLTAGFVAASAAIVGPALWVMHTRASPPVAAASIVRERTAGARYAVVYPAQMYVPAELLFPGVPKFEAEKTSAETLAASPVPVWRFGVPALDTETVSWPQLRPFFSLGMGRYLSVPFGLWKPEPIFGEGWFAEEHHGNDTFRWMGRRAVIIFPPATNPMTVRFTLIAPLRYFARPPELTVVWNGSLLDRREIRSDQTEVSYRPLPATNPRGKSILVLSSTVTFNPSRSGSSGDDRDLAFELRHLQWSDSVTSSLSPSSSPTAN